MVSITNIVKAFIGMWSIEKIYSMGEQIVRRNWNRALNDFEDDFNLSINLVPNERAIQFLSEHNFNLIKGMRDEIAEDLRRELTQALLNRENSTQISERVQKVMNVTEARSNAIARTESHRAYNEASFDAAKKSGIPLKKKVFNPNPDSEVCKALVNKPSINLDETWTWQGEEYAKPPFHVNCRSRLIYVQED